MLHFLLAAALQDQEPNPYTLMIGNAHQVTVHAGATDLANGKPTTAEAIAAACDGHRFLEFGESHDNTGHKRFLAEVIQALVKRGRNVALGMEMFTRPNQPNLAPWSMGYWTEEEFIEKSNWKEQWGFPYPIYKPVFDIVKANKIPIVALNVPRDWVRAVGKGGPDALPADAKGQVPPIDLTNANHRMVFNALMGGHPMGTEAQMTNIYSGQVLWDVGMSDTAVKYMDARPANDSRIMVILAGSGHALYHQGINYRIEKRTGEHVLTIIGIDGTADVDVSSTIGEWTVVCDKD